VSTAMSGPEDGKTYLTFSNAYTIQLYTFISKIFWNEQCSDKSATKSTNFI